MWSTKNRGKFENKKKKKKKNRYVYDDRYCIRTNLTASHGRVSRERERLAAARGSRILARTERERERLIEGGEVPSLEDRIGGEAQVRGIDSQRRHVCVGYVMEVPSIG